MARGVVGAALVIGGDLGLAQSLGIERRVVSRGHTVAIGFDLRPTGRSSFGFESADLLPGEGLRRRCLHDNLGAGGTNRVNMFTYSWKTA